MYHANLGQFDWIGDVISQSLTAAPQIIQAVSQYESAKNTPGIPSYYFPSSPSSGVFTTQNTPFPGGQSSMTTPLILAGLGLVAVFLLSK